MKRNEVNDSMPRQAARPATPSQAPSKGGFDKSSDWVSGDCGGAALLLLDSVAV